MDDFIRDGSIADVGANNSDENREEDGVNDIHNEDGVGGEGDGDDDVAWEFYKACRGQDLALAQLWVAGGRLLIPRLQNAVMSAWHELWTTDDRTCSTSWISYAYQHTSMGSPLRNLAVDQLAYAVTPSAIKARSDDLPREMLVDLVLVFSRAVAPIPIPAWDKEYEKDSSDAVLNKTFMVQRKLRYSCTRSWRNYLVPENEG